MTFPCKIDWKWPGSQVGEQPLNATVGSVDELRQQLASIRAEAQTRKVAITVVVVTPNTNIFSVVLGLGDGSIVTYDGRGGDPPYFVLKPARSVPLKGSTATRLPQNEHKTASQ